MGDSPKRIERRSGSQDPGGRQVRDAGARLLACTTWPRFETLAQGQRVVKTTLPADTPYCAYFATLVLTTQGDAVR